MSVFTSSEVPSKNPGNRKKLFYLNRLHKQNKYHDVLKMILWYQDAEFWLTLNIFDEKLPELYLAVLKRYDDKKK